MPTDTSTCPTSHCKQKSYLGIGRVSKENCRSIDRHQLLRHKRLGREHFHAGIRSKLLGPLVLEDS